MGDKMCQEPVTWHMVQTARRMKQRGYDTDEICKITGLPREEIEAL